MDSAELRNRFVFHPATADTAPKHEDVRTEFVDLALFLNGLLPESREKSLCLTALQEGMNWANAAIAIHLSPAAE